MEEVEDIEYIADFVDTMDEGSDDVEKVAGKNIKDAEKAEEST